MNTKRVTYFDIAKGIGVILVLLGHLQGDTIFSYSPYILKMCTIIFSFHMPLFFIISGMLVSLKHDNEKNFNELFKRRFRSIMIPYYWFSLIYIGIVIYTLIFKNVITVKTLFIQIWYVVSMYGMNVLWFLPALFLGELLFIWITQHFDIIKSIIIQLTLILMAVYINYISKSLPNNLEIYERIDEFIKVLIRPVFASSFIFIGFLMFKLLKLMELKVKENIINILLIPSVIMFMILNVYISQINQPVDFRSMVMNNYFLYYIGAVSGSTSLILFSKLLSEINIGDLINKNNSFKILRFFGTNSLIFMAVHNNSAVLTFALKTAMYLNQYLTRARGYICYTVVVSIIIIYVTLTILIINKFFPFITGKSLNQSNRN